MSGRFFLDTNIFVYTFDPSEPRKAATAEQLIRTALSTGNGLISYQVVQEFLNVALRRFSPPMSPVEAEQYLGTVFQPLISVHPSISLCSEALRIHSSSRLSWYDSLIVGAALQTKCDLLYSEDLQHGQRFGNLRIVNPFV